MSYDPREKPKKREAEAIDLRGKPLEPSDLEELSDEILKTAYGPVQVTPIIQERIDLSDIVSPVTVAVEEEEMWKVGDIVCLEWLPPVATMGGNWAGYYATLPKVEDGNFAVRVDVPDDIGLHGYVTVVDETKIVGYIHETSSFIYTEGEWTQVDPAQNDEIIIGLAKPLEHVDVKVECHMASGCGGCGGGCPAGGKKDSDCSDKDECDCDSSCNNIMDRSPCFGRHKWHDVGGMTKTWCDECDCDGVLNKETGEYEEKK